MTYAATTESNKKRTKYSKNGCQECKRMKVKCDEGKPACARCSKSSKNCIFLPSKQKNPEKKSCKGVISTMEAEPNEPQILEPASSSKSSLNSSPSSFNSFNRLQSDFTRYDFMEMINEDITSKFDRAIDSSLINLKVNETSTTDSDLIDQVDQNILKNLVVLAGSETVPNKGFLETDTLYQIPFELFSPLKNEQHKFYLEVFYREYSHVILPMEPQLNSNPIRDMLLQHSFRKNYLFYAILATGARYSFNKRFLDEDQENYSKFMKITLEMLHDLVVLKDFIPNINDDDDGSRIETLLLTILILTSDNASSMKQSWRGHLKGAKDLLYKIFILKRFNHNSKVLIFCKLWFTSFEVLACLTAPRGGTIKDESEWKSLIFDGSDANELKVLQELNLITKEGFNLLLGYHNTVLCSLVQLIDVMKSYQTNNEGIELSESIFQLILDFKSNQHLSMIRKVPSSTVSTYRDSSTGDVKTISWYDICHESHVDASLLTIMTSIFGVSKINPIIQGLVRKILSRLEVLNGNYEILADGAMNGGRDGRLFSLMLLQWPLLVSGLHSTSVQDKKEVEGIFRLLESLGSGSSKFAIDKIKRFWNNEMSDDEDVDIVTY